MAIGPGGKYDDICTIAREKAGAKLALVMIIGGLKGSGFSMQATDSDLDPGRYAALVKVVPSLLRDMADRIEKDEWRGEGDHGDAGDRPPR